MQSDRSDRRKIGAFRFSVWDVCAIVLIAAFAVYHVCLAHIGFHNPDETYFLAVAQRFLLGDSMIVDEWQLTQFTTWIQMVPFWLYSRIAGNTEGVVLFFRCLFAAAHALFGAWIYRALRSDPRPALVSLLLYLSFIPWLTLTVERYHFGIFCTVFLGIRLFLQPAKGRFGQIVCGAIYALLVLAEPLTVLWYPVYIGLVVFDHRKNGGTADAAVFRNRSFFIRTTVGIAITAALFLAFLFSRASIHEVLLAVPKLLQDSEYPVDRSVRYVFTRFLEKDLALFTVGQKSWAIVPLLLLPAAAAVLAHRHMLRYKNMVAFLSALFLAFLLYMSLDQWAVDRYLLIPFVWFGLVCILLTEKKDRRLAAFYGLGLIFAVLQNVSSDSDRGVCMIVPALVCPQICRAFAGEIHAVPTIRNRVGNVKTLQRRKRVRAVYEKSLSHGAKPLIAACLCAVLLTQGVYLIRECRGDYFLDATTREDQTQRKPDVVYDTELRRGPYRGIKTTAERAGIYEDVLQDLDRIRAQMHADDTFYIANVLPWGYLYMDVSVYTPYSAYCVVADIETRQFQYWEMHPEKMPDYIYLPDIRDPWYETDEAAAQETLQILQERFVCQTTEGKRGVILHVTGDR